MVAQRICRSLESTLGVTITVGLACLPQDTLNGDELIKMADKAMYWGKTNGKNRIVVYSPEITVFK